ncbi:AGE family epimerase/isomerase [Rhodocytophaga aerolata]|uniref:Cellobiose 2-epimerase n=1 Tax=Rhodocytophaga aerolata TaxID=455078 RepID=A0ABT8R104_9BACT|nr:AGE family epimerase/isomerase [Rhodocytophaga aerolata]MDO1445074.1 AGE family epimerase/isomerase [Rhodocytophaga aerolata]
MIQSATTSKLQIYKAEAQEELVRMLDFWMKHALDEKNGGFVGKMDRHLSIDKKAPKGSVLHARILWTFSAAFRHTNNPAYLEIAHRAYTYLLKRFYDTEYGGIYWAVDTKGKPLHTRKQSYALAFAIYGLSEYYRATAKPEALQTCQVLFYWLEKYSFDPAFGGYFDALSREGELLEDLRLSEKDRNDPKTLNTHLPMLEAYANLYRIWPDKQVAQQLEALLETFLHHIVDTHTGHMQLFFTADWTATTRLVSHGHDIETSWVLQQAAEVLGNEELIEKTKATAVAMARITAKAIQPDGSLYHTYDEETGLSDTHRVWWVSAEAMVGFMNAYQLTEEEHFLDNSWDAWQFAKKYLLDKEKGEWLWGVDNTYTVIETEDKISFWKSPHPSARMCIEIVNRCQRVLAEAQYRS